MGVTIFKTKDVEPLFYFEDFKVLSSVNVVNVEHSRVTEFNRPENRARLFLPERWPALYARLEAFGKAGVVPNIYVAHPLRGPDGPNSEISDYMMGEIVLVVENIEPSTKLVYFKSYFALRAVDGNRKELALWADVGGAGERINRVSFPNFFLSPRAMSIESTEKEEIDAQVDEDLSRRALSIDLWWGKDVIGPRITVDDLGRNLKSILRITAARASSTVLVKFYENVFENDTILIASVIDEQKQKISSVVLAFEKDGEVLREFFGKAQADSGGSGSGDRGGAKANGFLPQLPEGGSAPGPIASLGAEHPL